MQFYKYVRGEWETDDYGPDLKLSGCKHSLTFICEEDELTPQRFSVCTAANDAEFLNVLRGFLVCSGVFVSLQFQAGELTEYKDLIKAANARAWILRYDFIERAGHSWNEVYHPAGEGKLRKRQENIITLSDMGRFFGADDFPLTTTA